VIRHKFKKMINVFTEYKPDIDVINIDDVKKLLFSLKDKVIKLLLQRVNEIQNNVAIPQILDEKMKQYHAFVGIDFGTDGTGITVALPDYEQQKIAKTTFLETWTQNKEEKKIKY